MARLKFPVKIYDKGQKVVVLIRSFESIDRAAVVDLSITQVCVFQGTSDGQCLALFVLSSYVIADLPVNRHVGGAVFGIHRRSVIGNTELKQPGL